jgi:hypothetical protein
MTCLAERAMLLQLSVHLPQKLKHDRDLSAETLSAHGVADAEMGTFTKSLFTKQRNWCAADLAPQPGTRLGAGMKSAPRAAQALLERFVRYPTNWSHLSKMGSRVGTW